MQRLSMRRALAPAIASAAVLLHLNATRKGWSQVRIALGGVAPRVMRAHKAEAVLTHVPPFGSEFAQGVRRAGDAAREEANPVSDVWATSWYRRHVIGVLTQRALLQAAKAADAA